MPLEEFTNGTGNALHALLFISGALYALDTFSTLHSSPYTAEVRGGSAENADRVRHWVNIAVGTGIGFGIVTSFIARTPWPMIGAVATTGGMWWAYNHALSRGGADVEQELG